MTFDSDYLVRELAKSLGLHQSFGPVPSVEMLLQDLALRAHGLHHRLALKTQLPWHSWNSGPIRVIPDAWFLIVDHPSWGNNAEASTSSGYKRPILEPISKETINQEPQLSRQSSPVNLVQPNEDDIANSPSDPCGQEQLSINAASLQPDSSEGMNLDQSKDLFAPSPIAVITPLLQLKESLGVKPLLWMMKLEDARVSERRQKPWSSLIMSPERRKELPTKLSLSLLLMSSSQQ
jgi:hypothetical protein